MTSIKDLTTEQIHKIIAIKKKIEKLEKAVSSRIEKLHHKIESISVLVLCPIPLP